MFDRFSRFGAFAARPHGGGPAPVPFTPADLFASGQAGHWPGGYDPADGRIWQGATSPASEAGHPVGIVLDISAGTTPGAELIPNPDFTGGLEGWTASGQWSWSAGEATLVGSPDSTAQLATPDILEQHGFYLGEAETRYVGSGRLQAQSVWGPTIPLAPGGMPFICWNNGNSITRHVAVFRSLSPIEAYLSRFSVRRLPGHPTLQATALSRPTLRRWPKGGRRNLLTWTEGFTNPAWPPSNAVPSSGMLAEDNELSGHYLRQTLNPPFAVGVPGTASIEVKEGTARYAQVCLTGGNRYRAVAIDLRTGATDSRQPATMSPMPPEVVTPLEDGWFRLSFSAAPLSSGTLSSLQVSVLPDLHETAPGTGGVVTYQGSGKNILVRNAQCELGTVATPYQRVTTANDITEAGVPAVWHLWDDGGDSLPVTLPSGTYGRARVDTDGGVTVDTVTDPVGVMSGTRQVDVILRQGAFSPDEEAAIRAYWARYQP